MLFINYIYAISIVMTMKTVQSYICRNDTNCQNISYTNRSLILVHLFSKEGAVKNLEKNIYVQRQMLRVPNEFQIYVSVKIGMDPKAWKTLPLSQKRILWSKSRSQLYWNCNNSYNSISLCNAPGLVTTPSLTIDIYDTSKSVHYLQCSICFLKESNGEYVSWVDMDEPYIERVVFDLHKYLPQHLSNDQSAVHFQITRADRIPVDYEVGKIFVTNISLTDILNTNRNIPAKTDCQFFCGWGPKCLIHIQDICNGNIDCVTAEDEDIRLCKAIKNGRLHLKNNLKSTVSSIDDLKTDGYVLSTLKSYLFVIICSIILLALFILVSWFVCHNYEVENRFNGSSRKLNSMVATPDSDTSCSTCEMKAKLNSEDLLSKNLRRYRRQPSSQLTRLSGAAATADLQILKVNRKEPYFTAISSDSPRALDKESLKQLRNNSPYYSNGNRAIQSSEWLNLFFHVSTEARHKSLLKQPPPNVNNRSSEIIINKNPTISATPLTCVFLAM